MKLIDQQLVGYLKMDISMFDHNKIKNDLTLRICQVCNTRKPKETGRYVPVNELTQKWLCQKCYELRNRR